MSSAGLNNPVQTHKVYDHKDRFVGFVSRRIGHCGQMHEGHGKRHNHSRVNLGVAIETCPQCQKVVSAQPQQATA
jgi:hypothetical protein